MNYRLLSHIWLAAGVANFMASLSGSWFSIVIFALCAFMFWKNWQKHSEEIERLKKAEEFARYSNWKT